jgi:hypothetical protein
LKIIFRTKNKEKNQRTAHRGNSVLGAQMYGPFLAIGKSFLGVLKKFMAI